MSDLTKIGLFAKLSEEKVQRYQSLFNAEVFEKGELIVSEGERGDRVYFVVAGLVWVYKINDEGKEITLALIDEGQMLGELSVLAREKRVANGECLGEVRVLSISREDFLQILSKERIVLDELLRELSLRVAQSGEMKVFGGEELKERVRIYSETLKKHHIDHLSQEKLAEIVGATRPRVTEVLAELREENVL